MTSGSRRSHVKSRHGCGQCKRKRIKCDERPPCCNNCTKWRQKCDYELLGYPLNLVLADSKHAQLPLLYQNKRVVTVPSIQPSLLGLNASDLELLHHFLTNTSLTLHKREEVDEVWQDVVPSQALSHEYLMHIMLAVSAIHIIHLRGLRNSTYAYLAYARSHHDQAVALFRSNIVDLTPSNCTAAVTFSVLLFIFSASIAEFPGALQDHDNISDCVAIIKSFRRYWTLFGSVRQWIEDGPLSRFPPIRKNIPWLAIRDSILDALRALVNFNATSIDNEDDKSIYHNTIFQIQQSLQNVSGFPIISWPVLIPQKYVVLLEQKRPMALIILAYGCVIAEHTSCLWFLHNLAVNITNSITKSIDPAWKQGLRWPLMELDLMTEELEDMSVLFTRAETQRI